MRKTLFLFISLMGIIVFLVIGCHRKSQQSATTPVTGSSKSATLHSAVDSTKNISRKTSGRKTLKSGGLNGEYYKWTDMNKFFADPPVFTRVDNEISFNWGISSPDSRIPPDHYAIRWTGLLMIDKEDDYKIRLDADDGAQLTIDNKSIIPMGLYSRKANVHLTQGMHRILLEYYQQEGLAMCYLFWSEPPYRETSIIPSDHLYYEESSYQP